MYQCAKCEHSFGSLTLFDAHQDVSYGASPAVSCKTPESLGLVLGPSGSWYNPDGLLALTRRLEAMAEGRRQAALVAS